MPEVIVQEVDSEKVILFGSRARSDSTAESDVDFIVVEAEPVGRKWKRKACRGGTPVPRLGTLRRKQGHPGILRGGREVLEGLH